MLQPGDGPLDVLLALARSARQPVAFAQLVEHRATDALGGEGLELHALAGLVARQRLGQADHADLDQVVDLHVRRQLGDHVVREPLHQRHVLLDLGVAAELTGGRVHRGGEGACVHGVSGVPGCGALGPQRAQAAGEK
jgi:hypothetical protein